ncbi:MAG: type II toxin-antitoxin system PemK/MazF family toxin [Pseudolabrys sp.]
MGTEQAGRRPALVLTPSDYHARSRRSVVCPITSNSRAWPWNVLLPRGLQTEGFVLVDQVRTIDREQRMFGLIEHAPEDVIGEVLGKLATLFGMNLSTIRDGREAK